MKQHLITIAALALSASPSYSREPDAPPAPTESTSRANYSITRDDKVRENIYVGHYGEILRLYSDWTAEAVMRGTMEVIYFRRKSDPPASQWPAEVNLDGPNATVTFHPPLFRIKPEDFTPEKMSSLGLMQMIVAPKGAPGGFRSLAKLREAKAKELDAAGHPYNLQQVGEYPWPPDSFWVSISTPYRLFQLYTQSDKNFFIVTSGASPYDEVMDDPILGSATSRLCSSLSTHLDSFSDKLLADATFLHDMRITVIPWGAICTLSALLAFLPKHKKWLCHLRFAGRMMFTLTTATLFIAGPLLFVSWRMGLGRVVNEASIILFTGLAYPWICKAASFRLGGQRPRQVLLWTAGANIIPLVAGWTLYSDFFTGARTIVGYQDFWMLSVLLSVQGMVTGFAFGLTHMPAETKNIPRGAS